MKREITEKLHQWKIAKEHKCLMVRGARQVGKTYSITEFGMAEYASFIYINFLETPSLKQIFSGDLDTKTLLLNFSLYVPDAEFIQDNTLLFLDEIQECPEAITSLKFWSEDGRFDVIASGSMLGIDYKRPTSYPVGSVSYIDMYPLNFKEFLWAMGINDDIISVLGNSFDKQTKVSDAIHEKMMSNLRTYLIIGGMPEAVDIYIRENSIAAVDNKQRAILNDYRYDIAHYANADIKIKAEQCYFSLSAQLSKENHKFKYSEVEKGGTSRKYGSSLDWLTGAYLIKKVCNISSYNLPLESQADHGNFRVYPTDIGLLTAMFDYSIKEKLLKDDASLNGYLKGGIYEALIADMLFKNVHDRVYFRKDERSTFEIEFFIENKDGVIPIEVKAGKSRSKSLDNLLKKDEIPYGYKLIDGNAGKAGKKITLPLYMGMFL